MNEPFVTTYSADEVRQLRLHAEQVTPPRSKRNSITNQEPPGAPIKPRRMDLEHDARLVQVTPPRLKRDSITNQEPPGAPFKSRSFRPAVDLVNRAVIGYYNGVSSVVNGVLRRLGGRVFESDFSGIKDEEMKHIFYTVIEMNSAREARTYVDGYMTRTFVAPMMFGSEFDDIVRGAQLILTAIKTEPETNAFLHKCLDKAHKKMAKTLFYLDEDDYLK
jgi:hypothetical protein